MQSGKARFSRIKIYESEFLKAFDKLKDIETKQTIYYALKLVACSDQAVSKPERKLLETIAVKISQDKRELKQELEDMIKNVFAV
ncbi:TerB family tellurite resistance protein [Paenibacillus kobensis]|uniref:TerB family tellurite resistance protein n=1 Tax=Paenibacillus kobensis TaxID=59841 RepID=UPI000FDBD892|nr:TerB family tellurite resistance protein [Paenibacillus kobensis]